MSEIKLRECPICGCQEPRMEWRNDTYCVVCPECGLHTWPEETPTFASMAWNERAKTGGYISRDSALEALDTLAAVYKGVVLGRDEEGDLIYSSVPPVCARIKEIIRMLQDVDTTKHGHWIDDDQCSECGGYLDGPFLTDYCPNCGAKMDGGVCVKATKEDEE